MEKLTLCRICLVENVRMHVVADNHLQVIFEKLTNLPFITDDSRPMLACFFCYARLKQCYKFQQKCLEAEAVFTQMLDEEYEQKPIVAELEFFGGFLKTSVVHISIGDLGLLDDKREHKEDIKEELAGGYGRIDNLELKVEYHSDASEPETKHESYTGFEDNPMRIVFQSDSEDGIPLTRMKTGVEHVKNKRRATKKEREAREKSASVAKKPKLDIRKEKLADTKPTMDKKNEQASSKFINKTKSSKFKSVSKIEEPIKSYPKPSVIKKSCINLNTENAAICTNLSNNIDNDDSKCNDKGINSDDIKKHDLNQSNLSKVKPHKCDMCQRGFNYKSDLNRHISIHTGERPYKCYTCKSSFIQKSDLKRHIRIHTGEKPYKCDICERSFTEKNHLKNHIRIHTDLKPYKCDICQTSFKLKNNLKVHIRLHTREKPYKSHIQQRNLCA